MFTSTRTYGSKKTNAATTTNKVKKRKYVKRILRNATIVSENNYASCLTPDKSIHVNKPKDLFDCLKSPVGDCFLHKDEDKFDFENKDILHTPQEDIKQHSQSILNLRESAEKSKVKEDTGFLDISEDFRKFKLTVECIPKTPFNESIINIDDCSQINNKLNEIKATKNDDEIKNSEIMQITSTPYIKKNKKFSLYDCSPITFNSSISKSKNITEKLTSSQSEAKQLSKHITLIDPVISHESPFKGFVNSIQDKPNYSLSPDITVTIDISSELELFHYCDEEKSPLKNRINVSVDIFNDISVDDKENIYSKGNISNVTPIFKSIYEDEKESNKNCTQRKESSIYPAIVFNSKAIVDHSNTNNNLINSSNNNSSKNNSKELEFGNSYYKDQTPYKNSANVIDSFEETDLFLNETTVESDSESFRAACIGHSSNRCVAKSKPWEDNNSGEALINEMRSSPCYEEVPSVGEILLENSDIHQIVHNLNLENTNYSREIKKKENHNRSFDTIFECQENTPKCIEISETELHQSSPYLGNVEESFIESVNRESNLRSKCLDQNTHSTSTSNKQNHVPTNENPKFDLSLLDNIITRRGKTKLNNNHCETPVFHKTDVELIKSPVLKRQSKKVLFGEVECKDIDPRASSSRPSVFLMPGKKWERSLSIYKRMSVMPDNILETCIENTESFTSPLKKGRKYRESIANVMDMQKDQGLPSYIEVSHKGITRKSIFSDLKESEEISKSLLYRLSSLGKTPTKSDNNISDPGDVTWLDISKLSVRTDLDVISCTARDVVLQRCNQTEPIPFDECYTDTKLKNCRKIGEGVYGEVYLYRGDDRRGRVMKVIPINGDVHVNGEPQKTYAEIITEIVIAMQLSDLRRELIQADEESLLNVCNATNAFNEVLAVKCVYGKYPDRLLDLWDLYNESVGSENDSPGELPQEQHYIVLELAHAGTDLEGFQFNNAQQAYSVFYQVAFALAVAEQAYQFEHRDLHWGNVLITTTDDKYCTFVLSGRSYRVACEGVKASIIDYSLSRMTLTEETTLYSDLAGDPTLFQAAGDYQFDIYRLMKDRIGNDWSKFDPYNNLLWLHYIIDKMITALRYRRTTTKVHIYYIALLKELKGTILTYNSTVQFVVNENYNI